MHRVESIFGLGEVIRSRGTVAEIQVDTDENHEHIIDYLLRCQKRYDFSIEPSETVEKVRQRRTQQKRDVLGRTTEMANALETDGVESILLKGSLSYKNNFQLGWSDVDLIFIVNEGVEFTEILHDSAYDPKLTIGPRNNSVNFYTTQQIEAGRVGGIAYDLMQIKRYASPLLGENPLRNIQARGSSFSQMYTLVLQRVQYLHEKSQEVVYADSVEQLATTVGNMLKMTFIMIKDSVNAHRPELVLEFLEDVYHHYQDLSLPNPEALLELIIYKESWTLWTDNRETLVGIADRCIRFGQKIRDHILDRYATLEAAYEVPETFEYTPYSPPMRHMDY